MQWSLKYPWRLQVHLAQFKDEDGGWMSSSVLSESCIAETPS